MFSKALTNTIPRNLIDYPFFNFHSNEMLLSGKRNPIFREKVNSVFQRMQTVSSLIVRRVRYGNLKIIMTCFSDEKEGVQYVHI